MINEIMPSLFIGDQLIASNQQFLEQIGITHIVNLSIADGVSNYYPEFFKYYSYMIYDKPN